MAVLAAGHQFYLEGFQPKKKKEIQAEIVSRGGKITFMLNKEVSYYCADPDWTGRSTKLAKVQKDHPNVKIITESELRKQLALLPLIVVAPPAAIETTDQQQDDEPAAVVEDRKELPSFSFSPLKTAAAATPKGTPSSVAKRPLTRSAPNTPSKQQKNVVLAPRIPSGPDAPSVTLVLPESIPIHGDCKVAIFGLNFKPGSAFRVALGTRIIDDGFEFHCGTAFVLHLPSVKALPTGDLLVSASNDSGRHFGMSTRIRAVDPQLDLAVAKPHDEKMALLAGQVQNLSRALQQLQSGFENASKLEATLRGELQGTGAPGMLELDHKPAHVIKHHPPQITHAEPSRPAPVVHAHAAKPAAVVAAAAAPVASAPHSEPDREIKIFISSPFKDLQEERNLMVKRMIPKLKKMCMERDVVLTYVDLRWGVTDVQGEQAAALLMCLRELDKSNLMIGCFGERYGWCLSEGAHIAVKKSEKDKLLERSFDIAVKEFPWLEEFRDRSMTEVEMRMHMLNKSSVPKKAWFYLRDPYYLESIPAAQKPNFVSEGEFEHAKLESLKQELRSAYNAVEYHRPAEFAETVTRDIESYIDEKFPRENKLSADESERFRHRAFAKFLCRIYLPNEANAILLDKYVSGSKQSPLVVSGETGTGKSSLLANWSLRHAAHHPEDIVISHFVGCTPSSTGYLNTINRIMTDLADITGQNEARPSNENLITEWPAWVARVLKKAQRHKLVLVIDGLDALDERDKAHDLIWLPFSFPSSVRVVLSSSSGQCMNVLKRRGYDMLEVRPLEEGERIAFLRMYLNWNSKKLSDKQEFAIAAAKQTANPRFLKILLEDICVFGDFAALDKRIESDLKAKNASELYEIVLERVERDYDADKKSVVRTFMSYIWGSRRGLLLDSELRPLLEEKNINPSEWEPIVLVLEDILFSAGGLLNFSNRDIQKAVENRYLKKDSAKKEVHQKLASLFAKYEGAPARKMDEWPYQLFKAAEWSALVDCLRQLDNFCLLFTPERKYDLNAYWRAIEKNSAGVDCVSTYQRALVDGPFPADMIRADVYFKIGSFLEEIARFDGAEKAYKEAVLHYRNSAQNLDVARANSALARLYITTSKHDLAEQLLNETLEVYNREHGEGSLDASHVMNRLGALYLDSNQLEKAEENFKKALQIRAAKLGPTHSRVGQTLKHMLTLYELQGRWDEATECGQRALQITETEFGPEDVNVAGILRRMGRLRMNQGKFTEAIETLNRALAIAEMKYGPDHPNTGENIYGLACVAFLQNKYDEAEELFRKALRIKEMSLGEDHPEVATIVNRLGTLYIEQSRFADAESAFTRALASYEKKLGPNHSRVGQVLKHMLTLFELQERFDKALECGQRALRITEKIFGPDHFHVSSILLRLGPLQWNMGDIERGRESLIRSISIREKARGATDKSVTEAKKILSDLENPPPPPAVVAPAPPPPPPSKEECKPPPTTPSRSALLDEIRKRGERKQKEQEKQAQQQQQQLQQLQQVECESASAGKKAMHKQWWKQNYNYNAATKKASPYSYGSPQAYGSPASYGSPQAYLQMPVQQQQQQMAPRPAQPSNYGYPPQQQQQQQQQAPRPAQPPPGHGYPPQQQQSGPPPPPPPAGAFKAGVIPTRVPPPAPPPPAAGASTSIAAPVPPNAKPPPPPPPPPPPSRH